MIDRVSGMMVAGLVNSSLVLFDPALEEVKVASEGVDVSFILPSTADVSRLQVVESLGSSSLKDQHESIRCSVCASRVLTQAALTRFTT